MAKYDPYDEDDGRVIADMSDLDRPPMVLPRFGGGDKSGRRAPDDARSREQVTFDREARRAVTRGVVSAWLVVGGVIALAFAAIILLIGHMG